MTEGKGVSASTPIDGQRAFDVIGGNCTTALQCCTTIQGAMKDCPSTPDVSEMWTALNKCLTDCVSACESGSAHFGVSYAPAPTVLCPV